MNPIRLRGPADVLAALPYQLGYHPTDAVVVVALSGRAVGLVQRLDLPPAGRAAEAVAALLPALARERPDAVLIVGYEERPGQAMPVLDALRAACREASLEVVDRLVVRCGRWYAPDCTGSCCPEEGTPLPRPADTPAVADFVAMEVAPLPDRACLEELLEPDDADRCADVAAAAGRLIRPRRTARGRGAVRLVDDHSEAVRRLRWLSEWATACDVSAGRRPVEDLRPEEVASLAVSLRDVALRDGLVAWLCPGSLPLGALHADLLDQLQTSGISRPWSRSPATADSVAAGRRLQARLVQLCRQVPDEHAAPMLTLLANLTWWLGDGALTRVALTRALRAEPDYRLARLLERMVSLAIRPRASA